MASVSTPPPTGRDPLRVVVGACVAIGLLLAIPLVAVAFVTLTAITSDSVERRARTFPPVERLRIDPGGGDVTVVGERRADVRVEMRIHRNAWRDDWQPTVKLMPDRVLRLGSDCSVWMFAGTGECGASFTVRVPSATAVAVLGGGSSDVRLDALSGPLDVSTGSGDIEVDGYRGAVVSAAAGSGDIELWAVRAPRRLRAQAGSGDVTVVVPDVPYRVAVDTGSGDEDIQVIDDPSAEPTITVRTGSGDVEVVGVGGGG
jgi:hypothetical protein